jgi:hypothetical protein
MGEALAAVAAADVVAIGVDDVAVDTGASTVIEKGVEDLSKTSVGEAVKGHAKGLENEAHTGLSKVEVATGLITVASAIQAATGTDDPGEKKGPSSTQTPADAGKTEPVTDATGVTDATDATDATDTTDGKPTDATDASSDVKPVEAKKGGDETSPPGSSARFGTFRNIALAVLIVVMIVLFVLVLRKAREMYFGKENLTDIIEVDTRQEWVTSRPQHVCQAGCGCANPPWYASWYDKSAYNYGAPSCSTC